MPGSGFGEVDGTYHFRITILPRREEIENVLELFKPVSCQLHGEIQVIGKNSIFV